MRGSCNIWSVEIGIEYWNFHQRSIFQTFWKLHCCTKSVFFELETSNFGYLLIFWFPLTVQSFSKIEQQMPILECLVNCKIKKHQRGDPYEISMLYNLAETLHSSAKLKICKQPKFEVSNSKNKDLVTQCTFQKVWKILLSILNIMVSYFTYFSPEIIVYLSKTGIILQ